MNTNEVVIPPVFHKDIARFHAILTRAGYHTEALLTEGCIAKPDRTLTWHVNGEDPPATWQINFHLLPENVVFGEGDQGYNFNVRVALGPHDAHLKPGGNPTWSVQFCNDADTTEARALFTAMVALVPLEHTGYVPTIMRDGSVVPAWNAFNDKEGVGGSEDLIDLGDEELAHAIIALMLAALGKPA